jgi:hypothetical protein
MNPTRLEPLAVMSVILNDHNGHHDNNQYKQPPHLLTLPFLFEAITQAARTKPMVSPPDMVRSSKTKGLDWQTSQHALIAPQSLFRTLANPNGPPSLKQPPPGRETAPARHRGGKDHVQSIDIEAHLDYHRALDAARLDKLIDLSNRAKRRDREARQQRQPLDRRMAHFRLPELERIYADRWGPVLPDDDAGRSDLFIAFNHIAFMGGDVLARMAANVGTVDGRGGGPVASRQGRAATATLEGR